MIASSQFNYQEIVKKAKKVDKKIAFSENMRYLKKVPYTAFGTGFLITILVWICSLVGIVSGSFSILESLLTAGIIFLLVSFFSFRALSKKMDINSYRKIKKIQKRNYQVYQYQAHIDGIYDSAGVSVNTNMEFSTKKGKNSTYIMVTEEQKIYLDNSAYESLKKEKKVNLYIAGTEKIWVLFGYEKI